MKKLLLLLVLAAPCALFSQVAFDPNMLVFNLFRNDTESVLGLVNPTPAFWDFFGAFPSQGTIDVMQGTSLTGNALDLTAGIGISISDSGIGISGLGLGIGYTITVTSDGNNLILNAKAVDAFFPFSHSILMGFDTVGINLTPAQALALLKNGSISQTLFNALLRGSSADFQAQMQVLQEPPPPSGDTGSSGSENFNIFSGSTDELGGLFDSPPIPDNSVTWPDVPDQVQGFVDDMPDQSNDYAYNDDGPGC